MYEVREDEFLIKGEWDRIVSVGGFRKCEGDKYLEDNGDGKKRIKIRLFPIEDEGHNEADKNKSEKI